MANKNEFAMDRTFASPIETVWQIWTNADHLARWYGPGVKTIIHEFNPTVGGVWHNEMKWGETSMLSKAVFTDVSEPTLLVWDHYSNTDRDWNSVPNEKMPEWPDVVKTTVTLETSGDNTKLRLLWAPYEATETQQAFFNDMAPKMAMGWQSGFAIIDEIVSELQ